MAFVSRFEHDVCVCYADVDNAVLPPAQVGWIDQLVDVLTRLLGQQGIRELSVYSRPRGNQTLDEHVEIVNRSATVVLVTSPAYVESPWRADPRFKNALRSFGDGGAQRMFVVERDRAPWDNDNYEDRCRHDRFWRAERGVTRVLGSPDLVSNEKDTKAFYEVATDLAVAIAAQLVRLNRSQGVAVNTNSAGNGTIYLAHGIDAVHDVRAEVQRQLEQAGFEIVPRGRLPGDGDRFDEEVRRLLAGTRVFVQLLGTDAADPHDVIPNGITRRQYELARERGERVEILQWRDSMLDLSAVASTEQKKLLTNETVRAESVSDFCAAVRASATRPTPLPRSTRPTVLVDVPRKHVNAVEELFARYAGVRWDWHEPKLATLRTLLRAVEGVILYWGEGESDRTQERYYLFQRHFKVLKKPLERLLIYDGPPPEKPNFSGQGFPIADGRNGNEPEALLSFLQEIAGGED
jgi:hypothetical protein